MILYVFVSFIWPYSSLDGNYNSIKLAEAKRCLFHVVDTVTVGLLCTLQCTAEQHRTSHSSHTERFDTDWQLACLCHLTA